MLGLVRKRLSTKFILSTLLILLCMSTSSVVIYYDSKADLERNIGQAIVGIANTGKLFINIEDHENIFRDDDGEISGKESFTKLKKDLVKVMKVNGLSKPVYTLRPAFDFDKTKELEFVVMTDVAENGKPYTGNRIKASTFALEALKTKKAVTTPLYTDSEGTWISAIVPLLDPSGHAFALLYVDRDAMFFNEKLSELRMSIIVISILSFGIGLIVFLIVLRSTLQRIKLLSDGTEKLAKGDLSHRIEITGTDELCQLSNSFNNMTTALNVLTDDIKETNVAYSRFVPKQFLQYLNKESIKEITVGDQVQKEMTVLFTDIREFTAMSESMNPQDNFNFLNSYLSRMQPIVSAHNGFIDKYIGDAIMALFPDKTGSAIQAAVEMQKEIIVYNELRQEQGYRPIRVGMGAHTGNLMLGMVGGEERMEGTVIADAVNLSARLQDLTKVFPSQIIISETTRQRLGSEYDDDVRLVGQTKVKGKSKKITVYEVFTGQSDAIVAAKKSTQELFERAVAQVIANDYTKALSLFEEVLASDPQDAITAKYVDRLKNGGAAFN